MLFENVMRLFRSGLVSISYSSSFKQSSSPDRVIGGAPFRRPSQLISPATAQFLHRLEAIPSRALPEIIHFGQGPQVT